MLRILADFGSRSARKSGAAGVRMPIFGCRLKHIDAKNEEE